MKCKFCGKEMVEDSHHDVYSCWFTETTFSQNGWKCINRDCHEINKEIQTSKVRYTGSSWLNSSK